MNKLIIIFLLGLLACSFKKNQSKEMTGQSYIGSTVISSDTSIILDEEFRAFGTKEYILYVLNSKGDTVFKQADLYFDFEFSDFNNDGLNDIVIHRLSNVPAIQDLLLFDSAKMGFTIVKDFERFPDPKPIPGTKYYFSYHRSGCADSFWDSDLFSIDNSETHLLGNISGNECEGKKGIVVTKIIGNEKKVVDTFELDTLESYDDRKWGFIADYWAKNYSKFIK
ncbi:MAG: hypothetical protein ABI663_18335 [Chryseolinea sp.]